MNTPDRRELWQQGLRLARDGEFWEAHEAIEDIWRAAKPGGRREALQALIQTFAAAYKIVQAGEGRAAPDMQRGMEKLIESARGHLRGVDSADEHGPTWSTHPVARALSELEQVLERWRAESSRMEALTAARRIVTELVDELPNEA